MGKLYNLLNDPQNAILAFQQVLDYSPSYDIEFNARLELGKAYREAGQPEKALNIFDDMSSRKNYSEFYDQIDLELGTTQVDLKNYKEAYNYFKTVDTGFTNSKSAGIAKYKLGELYQYYFFNFDSASYYYSKSVTSRLPEEFILSANDKIQKFRKYKTLSDNISQNYKKLEYVENPESFVKDSIAYYSDTVKTENPVSTETNISSDNRRGRFNDRRFSEMSKSEIQASNTTAQKTGKGIPPIRPNISADSIKSLLVQNLFELGNLFFTEFNLPDSAYYYYSKVLNDYPDSKYQARTMYALGSYYLTINENAKADSLFNIIYDNYKNENVVNAAANKLNKPLIDLNYDPAVSLYDSAEKRLTNKNYTASLKEFYNIYKSYPQSTLAPKALYATGWILENQLNMPDSAALFYDTLTARYPKTVYAVKISKGIDFYNQEKARIKKAYEDSLALVKKARLDSLKADSLRVAKSISVGKASYDSVKTEKPDSLHKNNNKIPLLPGKEEKLKGIDTSQKSRKTLVP
jgi:TolA-binding protein